jgi:Protein of unknown function (DUF3567)
MQMLYNSDSFVVVAFEVPTPPPAADGPADLGDSAPAAAAPRGGFEIVDKLAGKEIFIQGPVAASFQQGMQALVAEADSQEAALAAVDEYLAGYATLAQQPVRLH